MTNHENTNNEAKDSSQIILFHSASYELKKTQVHYKAYNREKTINTPGLVYKHYWNEVILTGQNPSLKYC